VEPLTSTQKDEQLLKMVEAIPDYDAAKERDGPLDSLVKKFER
jgi:hypothetical protein